MELGCINGVDILEKIRLTEVDNNWFYGPVLIGGLILIFYIILACRFRKHFFTFFFIGITFLWASVVVSFFMSSSQMITTGYEYTVKITERKPKDKKKVKSHIEANSDDLIENEDGTYTVRVYVRKE